MGIITKTVKIRPKKESIIEHYKNKGYEIDKEIEVKVEDLHRNSCADIYVCCDICGKEKWVKYHNYMTSVERGGYYACKDCINIKREDMVMQKYGVKYTLQVPEVIAAIEETCLEKYGYKYSCQSPKVREKIKTTNLERIGVESPFMLPETHEKANQTKLKRYGTTNTTQLPEVQEKMKNTLLIRLGVENAAQSPVVREKMKKTCLEIYGYEYASQSPIVKEKIKNTNLIEYGVPVTLQNPIVQGKIKNTCIERFGVPNAMQCPEIREKAAKTTYLHGTQKTSKQQLYLYNLYGGELNYPCETFNLDILLDNIDIEYDGGGHELSLVLEPSDDNKFLRRQMVRSKVVKQNGYKTMRIISRKDNLPSDAILLDILSQSKQYFEKYPNHSWREWDIDNGIFRDAEHKDGEPYDFGPLRKIRKSDVEKAS